MNSIVTRLEPGAIYAAAAIAEKAGLVFLTEVAEKTAGEDIKSQTEQILRSVEETLNQAGSGKDRLLLAVFILRNPGDAAQMNEVWKKWLPEGAAPARATCGAELLNPSCLVELILIAAK
jgi:enamine deaminase RidA (YjgF/YER057c/UK114 family)